MEAEEEEEEKSQDLKNIRKILVMAQFQVLFLSLVRVCCCRRDQTDEPTGGREREKKVTERVIGVSELSTFGDWPRASLLCVCVFVVFVYMTDPIKLATAYGDKKEKKSKQGIEA